MVRAGILDNNQHENKLCCAVETPVELYRLDKKMPHFAWYGKNISIHELRTFGRDIYPTTPSPKILYDRKK